MAHVTNSKSRGISTLANDERGAISIIAAIAVIPVLLAGGAAIDYVRHFKENQRAQHSVDAAVLAAAVPTIKASEDERRAIAAQFFEENFVTGAPTKVLSHDLVFDGDRLTATAEIELDTSFMHLGGVEKMSSSVSATAELMRAPVCILALSEDKSNALKFQGSPDLNAPDCAVHGNSDNATALKAQGNPKLHPKSFCVAGGYQARRIARVPITGCDVIDDPLDRVEAEAEAACTDTLDLPRGNHTVSPGTYCGIKLAAHANVRFEPGVYVIENGKLNIKANAVLAGDGVAFALTGDSSFSIHAGATFGITPPDSGDLSGILINQDHDGDDNLIYGGGSIELNGIIHTPAQNLLLRGGFDMTMNVDGMAIIADTFTMQGSPSLTIVNESPISTPRVDTPTTLAGVRLIY